MPFIFFLIQKLKIFEKTSQFFFQFFAFITLLQLGLKLAILLTEMRQNIPAQKLFQSEFRHANCSK